MIEISYWQMLLCIIIVWIIMRLATAIKNKSFSVLHELRMLPVLVCIVVITRFVYFSYHLVNGRIDTLKVGCEENLFDGVSFTPFLFLTERYEGWKRNIIGNIAMFIPVGLVWPFCFKELDSFKKVVLAGAVFSLLIELTQLVCYNRHSDIDDIILNVTGVAIGAFVFFAMRRVKRAFTGKE